MRADDTDRAALEAVLGTFDKYDQQEGFEEDCNDENEMEFRANKAARKLAARKQKQKRHEAGVAGSITRERAKEAEQIVEGLRQEIRYIKYVLENDDYFSYTVAHHEKVIRDQQQRIATIREYREHGIELITQHETAIARQKLNIAKLRKAREIEKLKEAKQTLEEMRAELGAESIKILSFTKQQGAA